MSGIVNQPALVDVARPARFGGASASPFGRSLIDDLNAGAARTTLGVGTGDSPTFTGLTLSDNYTNSGQPAFLAYNSVTDADVTGNNTTVTVDFDTEVFDQGADFTGDTFTAPVGGRYLLTANVRIDQMSGATFVQIRIVTSNNSYLFHQASAATAESLRATVVADMDANDTATVTVRVNGVGADTSDIFGDASRTTNFSGCLLA